MPKPKEYRHIYAWGRLLDSNRAFIDDEQERAASVNAPIDAIFERNAKDGSGPTGEWAVASDLPNDHDVFKLL